ncbi:MAG TPA: dienelactone hydrolase family protein [Streptomyces sp.]
MTIVLFHSACGLRPAVHAAADRLRAAGHEVHVPDLFDGRTALTVEEGMAVADGIGRDELLRRAITAAAPYSEQGLVYAGFSLGGSLAQNAALGDDRARGLLLLHGTSDIADDVATDIPVRLHVAEPDPPPAPSAREVPPEPDDWLNAWYLRKRKAGADVEIHRYRGAGRLCTDHDLPDHDLPDHDLPDHDLPDPDAEAATRTWAVALDFLRDL